MKPRLALSFLVAALLSLSALAQKPDVRLDVGSAPGAADSFEPHIAASGSSVYVVWKDLRNQLVSDIYFNRSSDGGATWLATDVRLDTGTGPGASTSEGPQVAASGSAVCVVWEDARNGSSDIYCNRSLDGGATWLPAEVRLDTGSGPGAAGSTGPRIAMSGSSVGVAWCDRRNGNYDIYCNFSADGGTTWLPSDVRLDTGNLAGATDSNEVQIAVDGTSIYVAWRDMRNSQFHGDIYANSSFDGGVNWLPFDLRLDGSTNPGLADSLAPRIAASGASVYVCWTEFRSGGPVVSCNRSVDGGSSWLPSELQLGPTSSVGPSIAASGSSVFVSWYDYRNGNRADIWCNCSTDLGATWLPNDVRLDAGSPPAAYQSVNPQIAAGGQTVEVVWEEHGISSTPRLWSNRSVDNGVTWLPAELRLDRGTGPGTGGTYSPRIAISGSSVYVAWQDHRTSGGSDIWFALASGFQRYGTGTAGTGAFTPVLTGSGNAAVGGAMSIDFTAGRGAAPGLLAIGLGPATQIAQPLLGGTLLVQPGATLFFFLGGLAGAPGGGSHSLLVPVPNNLNLLGLNANFQGLFLDISAVQGVSMSNAVATWIG